MILYTSWASQHKRAGTGRDLLIVEFIQIGWMNLLGSATRVLSVDPTRVVMSVGDLRVVLFLVN